MTTELKRIVIVGAGVIGLTTALVLSRGNRHDEEEEEEGRGGGERGGRKEYEITVAAKHMPGDYDVEYASPWAGANYLPTSEVDSDITTWERDTWPELEKLARLYPEAGIHFQDLVYYERERDENPKKAQLWYKDFSPDYKTIPQEQLPEGVDNGHSFTTVCINPAIYLPWLVSQAIKAGVVFVRGEFAHICHAADAHHSGNGADLVVNCTGLSARTLGGVEDADMVPIRGQTVLVRNETGGIMYNIDKTDKEPAYIMQRAAGGGTLIGGCYQYNNYDSNIDLNLANRIMSKAISLCPTLTRGKQGIEHLSIIRHGVGLRPFRKSGTRIAVEKILGLPVVHNYGHGGFGYQSSYGCANVVKRLVEDGATDSVRS